MFLYKSSSVGVCKETILLYYSLAIQTYHHLAHYHQNQYSNPDPNPPTSHKRSIRATRPSTSRRASRVRRVRSRIRTCRLHIHSKEPILTTSSPTSPHHIPRRRILANNIPSLSPRIGPRIPALLILVSPVAVPAVNSRTSNICRSPPNQLRKMPRLFGKPRRFLEIVHTTFVTPCEDRG